MERVDAGDVDGVVALYEADAVLSLTAGQVSAGRGAIRLAYEELIAQRPTLTAGEQQPALHVGELALTSTRLPGGGATAEVVRRQPDGTWLWVMDQPNVLGQAGKAAHTDMRRLSPVRRQVRRRP